MDVSGANRRIAYAALSACALAAPSAAALVLRTAPASGAPDFALGSTAAPAPAGFTKAMRTRGGSIVLRLTPNRVNSRSWASVRVPRRFDSAHLRVTFTSLEMHMPPATASLARVAPGRYAGRGPVFEMAGRWRVCVEAFKVGTVDPVRD